MQDDSQKGTSRSLSRLLDSSIRVPGTDFRFGLDAILGLIPGFGDTVTSLLGAYIIYQAWATGVSRWTLTRMVWNLAFDALLGSIPFLGDVTDFFWKANVRNMELWERSTYQGKGKDVWFLILCFAGLAGIVGFSVWIAIELVRLIVSS